jgi:hypothetical protein
MQKLSLSAIASSIEAIADSLRALRTVGSRFPGRRSFPRDRHQFREDHPEIHPLGFEAGVKLTSKRGRSSYYRANGGSHAPSHTRRDDGRCLEASTLPMEKQPGIALVW